jgi:hypothetical protein
VLDALNYMRVRPAITCALANLRDIVSRIPNESKLRPSFPPDLLYCREHRPTEIGPGMLQSPDSYRAKEYPRSFGELPFQLSNEAPAVI